MLSRRRFLATLLATSVSMIEAAAAKGNGGAGNGNGGGSGGGNGNGAGGGKGGGNGNGAGNGKGNAGGGAGPAAGPAQTPAATRPSAPPSLRLRHSNGFEEEIEGGRYEMRDNRGRQIVNRAVRNSDYIRLRRLLQ
jgi:hypothetical protein